MSNPDYGNQDDLTTKLKKLKDKVSDAKSKGTSICVILDDLTTKLGDEVSDAEKTAIVQLGKNIQAIEKAHREIFTAVENYEKVSDAESRGKSIREIEDDLTPKSEKVKSIREILDGLTTELEKEVSDAEKPAVIELGKNIQAVEKAYREIFTVVEDYGKKYEDYSKQEHSKNSNKESLKRQLGIEDDDDKKKRSKILEEKFKDFNGLIEFIDGLRVKSVNKGKELKTKLDTDGHKLSNIDLKKFEMDMAREEFAVDKTYGKQVESLFKELEDLYKKTIDKLSKLTDKVERGDIHILKDAIAIFLEHESAIFPEHESEPLKNQIELQKTLSDSLRKWVQKTGEYFDVQKKYLSDLSDQRVSLQKLEKDIEKDKVNYNDFRQSRRAQFLEEVQFLTEDEVKTK